MAKKKKTAPKFAERTQSPLQEARAIEQALHKSSARAKRKLDSLQIGVRHPLSTRGLSAAAKEKRKARRRAEQAEYPEIIAAAYGELARAYETDIKRAQKALRVAENQLEMASPTQEAVARVRVGQIQHHLVSLTRSAAEEKEKGARKVARLEVAAQEKLGKKKPAEKKTRKRKKVVKKKKAKKKRKRKKQAAERRPGTKR